MPRSMADPNYRYSPWTPERRKAASIAAKARHAAIVERERMERELARQGLPYKLRQQMLEYRRLQEKARQEWNRCKAAADALEKAVGIATQLDDLIRPFGISVSPYAFERLPTVAEPGGSPVS